MSSSTSCLLLPSPSLLLSKRAIPATAQSLPLIFEAGSAPQGSLGQERNWSVLHHFNAGGNWSTCILPTCPVLICAVFHCKQSAAVKHKCTTNLEASCRKVVGKWQRWSLPGRDENTGQVGTATFHLPGTCPEPGPVMLLTTRHKLGKDGTLSGTHSLAGCVLARGASSHLGSLLTCKSNTTSPRTHTAHACPQILPQPSASSPAEHRPSQCASKTQFCRFGGFAVLQDMQHSLTALSLPCRTLC